jgi:hypothetical protein
MDTLDRVPDFNKTVCAMLEVASFLENVPRHLMNFGCSRTSINPKILNISLRIS